MTDPKFSPGPWRWDDDGFLLDAEGNLLLEGSGNMEGDDPKLVAAAPELYDAVSNLLGVVDTPIARRKLGGDFLGESVSIARAALAKARGAS
jgi:hypothetical protein